MKYEFEINRKLPSLNEYTKTNRYNKYAANRMKKDQQSYIRGAIYAQLGRIRIEKPVNVHFIWVEENKRRDKDNIRFAAKFILDALVETHVLQNDNWSCVNDLSDSYWLEDKTRVIVELEEIDE